MNKAGKFWIFGLILWFLILIFAGVVFLVPFPYTATEAYIVQEPYLATETYTDVEPYAAKEYYQEEVPITEEECMLDISLNYQDYIMRGITNIDALLEGDISKLLETCQDVIKYRTVTKSKDVVRYKDVQKQRQVTQYRPVRKERQVVKKATLYMIWTGQVQYYYEA